MGQPSGGGQNIKDRSMSVVLASDHDPLPGFGGAASAAADAEASATTMLSMRSRLMAFNGATWDRVRSGSVAIVSTFVGFLNSLPYAIYNASPTTRSTGQGGPLEVNAAGSLRVAEQNPPAYENATDAVAQTHEKPASSAGFNAIPFDNFTVANQGVIKASPGNLYKIYFTNTNASAKGVALVDKASAPSSDAPKCYFYVPGNATLAVEFKFGKRFTTGIAWAQVTTIGAATITLDTAAMLVTAEAG